MKTLVNFSNWKNAELYDSKYTNTIQKKNIWNYKQNYPDLVVDDIVEFLNTHPSPSNNILRQFIYETLMKRGVNKWLFIRKLIIRLKKRYSYLMKQCQDEAKKNKIEGNKNKMYYYMGKARAYEEIRSELKTLCMGPRWVVWNYKEPGAYDVVGMTPTYASRFEKLCNILMGRIV